MENNYDCQVGFKRYARAVIMYCAEIGVEDAKSSYDEETGWYNIEIRCNMRERDQIAGFINGLEWFTRKETPCQ